MDNAAVIALAMALEIEFSPLSKQLKSLSEENDAQRFEDQLNAVIDHLPSILGGMVALTYAKGVLESLLATHYAEGIGSVRALKNTGQLMRPEKAYDAILHSGALKDAPNTLNAAKAAVEVRATALAKVIKGEIVQELREALKLADAQGLEQAQAVTSKASKALEDLSSNVHVNAHADAQAQLAKGYGLFSAQQTEAYLAANPFQEFYRAEHRVEWRNWPERWNDQGGMFFGGPSDYPEGRMIAETNSRIWQDLANYSDGTGSPYPPFAWNSGMSVRPIRLDEAKKLGLLGVHRKPQKPKTLDFNAGISFSADFDDDIKSEILGALSDWSEQHGEVIHK